MAGAWIVSAAIVTLTILLIVRAFDMPVTIWSVLPSIVVGCVVARAIQGYSIFKNPED